MKNMKFWRTALVATLVLTVMLSVTGGTIAWFTDSATSGRNVIQAGNLDVELYNAAGKVDENTSLFDLPTLWEPGAVAWENLTVKNVGTLALKYQMGMNYINENTVDGYGLSQVLKVGVVDGGFEANATRETVVGKVASWGTFASFGAEDTLAAGADKTYGVVVYWQPTAEDNNWNVNNGKTTSNGMDYLHIDLGLKLEATQQTAEFDSFDNQYDKDAPVILPAGVTADDFGTNVAATVGADGTVTYHSTMAAAAAAIHDNGVTTFALRNETDAPNVIYCKPDACVGTMSHVHICDDVTVYGNGAYVQAGGDQDFEVDTFTKNCAGLTKEITLNIYDLGGIAVWGQRTTVNAININLYNCQDVHRVYISLSDKETDAAVRGAITNINIENCSYDGTNGYNDSGVYTNTPGTINVKNTTFTKYAIPINLNNKSTGVQNINLTNCKFVDCAIESVVTDSNRTYAAPVRVIATTENTAVSNLNIVNCEYEYYAAEGPVDVNVLTMDKREDKPNNGTVNVKFDEEVVVTDDKQLGRALEAAESGSIVKVYDGTYTFPASDIKAGVTLECAEGTVFDGQSNLNINGATVVGATFSNEEGIAVRGTINGTFKDCTFTSSEALRWCYAEADKTIVFENCEIKTDFRGFHFDDMDGDVIFKNCTIAGFNACGGDGTLSFENCTFVNDNSSYNGLNLYCNTNLTNCTFNYVSGKTNFIDMEGTGKTLEITNCVATLDGAAADIADFVGGSKLAQNTLIIDDVTK